MYINKKKKINFLGVVVAGLITLAVAFSFVAKKKKPKSIYENEPEEKNKFEGKYVVFVEDEKDKENADGIRGHLEDRGNIKYEPSYYEKYIKRYIDLALSFISMVILSPIIILIALAIKIEDPGPIFFTQKRVGQNKQYFKLHKFRSMKMCTPHDVPTHMLINPDNYITKVGKFIRLHSLDELPQLWDIFIGNMSMIGPRPGLWNQDFLTSERDKYGVNNVKPGLTGWAQINGRDELGILDKVKLDSEYVQNIGINMDLKVLLKSFRVFSGDKSIVEGRVEKNMTEIVDIKRKEMKKRVLFLVNHDVAIYNFRLELVERLISEGYEVHISSPYGERIDDLKKLGAFFHEIKIDRHGINPIKELKLIMNYMQQINSVKPDIILGYTIKPNIYGAMVAGIKNIPFVANITGLGTAVENSGVVQKITVNLYKIAFRKVQRVFFQNSDNQKFFIKNNIAVHRHKLLPGSGVNLNRFTVREYPSDDIIRFAFISRIMKEKGIDQYLDVAKTIKQKYSNTEFHVCGFCEEEYEGKLNEYNNNGIVIYHGMIRDVASFMSNMSCIIHPSYYPEGLSNVLLEASASGRPIITTDRSGCREVVDDGVNGYIIPQKNSQILIKEVERFIKLTNEQKKSMGLAARKKVEREFDRQIVVEKYMKEIETNE